MCRDLRVAKLGEAHDVRVALLDVVPAGNADVEACLRRRTAGSPGDAGCAPRRCEGRRSSRGSRRRSRAITDRSASSNSCIVWRSSDPLGSTMRSISGALPDLQSGRRRRGACAAGSPSRPRCERPRRPCCPRCPGASLGVPRRRPRHRLVEVVGGQHAEHDRGGPVSSATRCRPAAHSPATYSKCGVSPRITAPRQITASNV